MRGQLAHGAASTASNHARGNRRGGTSTAGAFAYAGVEESRTQYLTFSKPVALPGVSLTSGTYIFELADPDAAHDVVRVLSRDRKTVFLTAFTTPIDRPANIPLSQYVSLREVTPGQAIPITVWWSDVRTGRQFIYTE
jgi:hypothetical protein